MQEKKGKEKLIINIIFCLAVTVLAALVSAFGLWIFVYPSNFAPSGVDGIATMLQALTSVNAGIYSLIINLPLLVIAWFFLKRKYVIYTIIFTVCNSLFLLLFEYIKFYQYTSNQILATIFSGIILGFRTGIMFKIGASSGGVDIIACIIKNKYNYNNVERIISIICYATIGLSFFVYNDIECILMSIIQMFVFEKTLSAVLADTRNAVEVKIITKEPDEIKKLLLFELKHGVTVLDTKGGFTDNNNTILYSVINKRQVPELMTNLKKFPNTFVYCSEVNNVHGNFRWRKNDEAK